MCLAARRLLAVSIGLVVQALAVGSAHAQLCAGDAANPNLSGPSGSVSVSGGSCVHVLPDGAVAGEVRTSGTYTITHEGTITNAGGFGIRDTTSDTTVVNRGAIDARHGIDLRARSSVVNEGTVDTARNAIRLRADAVVVQRGAVDAGLTGIFADSDARVENTGPVRAGAFGTRVLDRGQVDLDGLIDAGRYGIWSRDDGRIVSAGRILAGWDAIRARNRAIIDNAARLDAGRSGIFANNDATLRNRGDITSTFHGVRVRDRGSVTHDARIVAGRHGILGRSDVTVDASGRIAAGFDGIRLLDRGVVRNAARIDATRRGIIVRDDGRVENDGDLRSVLRGIEMRDDNLVVHRGSATSSTQQALLGRSRNTVVNRGHLVGTRGIDFSNRDNHVVNAGRVVGTSGTAIRFRRGTNTLRLQTGSRIQGALQGGTGSDSLFLEGSGRYDGEVRAFESLVRRGGGLWTLGGDSTIAGPARVARGVLEVEGRLAAASFRVDRPGTLAGSGLVRGDVDVAGAVSPGRAGRIDTLRVDGDVRFRRSSRLDVDVAPRGADRLEATGRAALDGGRIVIRTRPGAYRPDARYDVLVAEGGRTGRFTSVETVGSPVLQFRARVLRDRIRLELERLPYAGLSPLTPNQRSVASALDGIVARGGRDASSVAQTLDFLPGEEIAAALTALDPATFDVYPQLVEHWTERRFEAMTRRLRDAARAPRAVGRGHPPAGDEERTADRPDEEEPATLADLPPVSVPGPWARPTTRGEVWAEGLGMVGDRGSDGPVSGYDFDGSGAIVGGDLPVTEQLRLGLAATWQRTNVDVDRPGSRGQVDQRGLALYGAFESGGPLFADLLVQHLWNDYATARRIAFSGVNRRATSRHEGRALAAQASVGLRAEWRGTRIEPRVGVRATRLSQDAAREEGAGMWNLAVDARRSERFESFVGLHLAHDLRPASEDVVITPELRGAWARAWNDEDRRIEAAFTELGGQGFRFEGAARGRTRWTAGAGVTVTVRETFELGLHVDVQRGSDRARSAALRGGLTWRF